MLSFFPVLFISIFCTNYYVSFNEGNDSNEGTDVTKPFKTFSRVCKVSLKSGDKILLQRGNVWKNSLVLGDNSNISGITIMPYGKGEHPKIHLDGKPETKCLQIFGGSNVIVRGIFFNSSNFGIVLKYNKVATFKNIKIENCFFFNIINDSYVDPNIHGWGGSIAIDAAVHGVHIDGFSINNNFAKQVDTLYRSSGKFPPSIENGKFEKNTIIDSYFNIINLQWMKFIQVSNNVFSNNKPRAPFYYGTTDLMIMNLDNTSTISSNDFLGRGEFKGDPDGCGVDFEAVSTGTVFEYNLITRSIGGGVMIFGKDGVGSHNLKILNNVFIQAGCYQTSPDHGTIVFCKKDSSGVVSGNYFVRCPNGVEVFHETVKGASKGFKFLNNAIVNTTETIVKTPIITFKDGEITASCETPDAVLRYTFDNSRPERDSTVYTKPIKIDKCISTVFNVKGYKKGMYESETATTVIFGNPINFWK